MKDLKTHDIIKLIQAGKSAGVAVIQTPELIITYKAQDGALEWGNTQSSPSRGHTSITDDKYSEELKQLEDELAIEQLMITDPAAYEQSLFSGELDG